MKKVLVTGAAGFIGYHVCKKLIEDGHYVVGFDSYNDYLYPSELKHKRAQLLMDSYSVPIFNMDLKNPKDLEWVFDLTEYDAVIHLGAMAGVRDSLENAHLYIENNATGTLNLIREMEKRETPTVIFASTSCVMHGNPLPWGEAQYLYPQINPYGYTKYINESQFNISNIPNAMGIRFFTVYGPWGRPDMALFNFTKNILEDKPIQLYNYGKMKRDFTYVDDIVQGILCVFNNPTKRDMYNLGYGNQVDLFDFVKAIEKSTGKKAEIELAPKHPADALETWSDTSKIEKIGYKATTSVEEGVDNFVKWYRGFYN